MEKINKHEAPSAWFFAEWISIIGTFLVCFVFLFYQNQLQTERTDKISERLQQEMSTQSERSDKLYIMFAESQKEFHQKFYDLLKEGRK